jgi:mannose-6-phosphate isomerase-like protein (cupin superfamily)
VADDALTEPFDPSAVTIGIHRDGAIRVVPRAPGAPRRIDGHVLGAPRMTAPAAHAGEMHPDGDELVMLVSGRASVVLYDGERIDRVVPLGAGQAIVIPRGVFHRVVPDGPIQILHLTPGPRGEWRPLPGNGS